MLPSLEPAPFHGAIDDGIGMIVVIMVIQEENRNNKKRVGVD